MLLDDFIMFSNTLAAIEVQKTHPLRIFYQLSSAAKLKLVASSA